MQTLMYFSAHNAPNVVCHLDSAQTHQFLGKLCSPETLAVAGGKGGNKGREREEGKDGREDREGESCAHTEVCSVRTCDKKYYCED